MISFADQSCQSAAVLPSLLLLSIVEIVISFRPGGIQNERMRPEFAELHRLVLELAVLIYVKQAVESKFNTPSHGLRLKLSQSE